ncbi:MAG TPA: hypothetical protein ACFYEK_09090 [Candidatus Wunengus sp. YC60]|uniref:hypothetical protein n=1 Tax=Candidatus Wunengus sp. YC60 TaxID=3367697 RepID=UPI004026CE3C
MDIINTTLSNNVRKRNSEFPATAVKGKHGKDSFKIWVIGEEVQAREESPIGNDPTPYGSEVANWKNFFAITSKGSAANNIAFAKALLFDYIGVKANYTQSYGTASGLKAYIINPLEGQDIFRYSSPNLTNGLPNFSDLGTKVDNGYTVDFTEWIISEVGKNESNNVQLTIADAVNCAAGSTAHSAGTAAEASFSANQKIEVFGINNVPDGVYTVSTWSGGIITLTYTTASAVSLGTNPRTTRIYYSQAQKDWYNVKALWKSLETAWPLHTDFYPSGSSPVLDAKTRKCRFASGYLPSNVSKKLRTKFNFIWCFQTAATRAYVISRIIYSFTQMKSAHGIKPAGVGFDLLHVYGNFQRWNAENDGPYTTLNEWNYTVTNKQPGEVDGDRGDINKAGLAANSCVCPNHVHDKATVTEGVAAFITELKAEMAAQKIAGLFEETPRLIVEPARLYIANAPADPDYSITDEFIYQIKDRADKNNLVADMLVQEGVTGGVTEFCDSGTSGWPKIEAINAAFDNSTPELTKINISKNRIGSSQPTDTTEANNRKIAAKAAINGMWYDWFLRFFSAYSEPNNIIPRLQLVRCVPNWDNLNKVPEGNRSWDGTTYYSKMLAGDSTYWSFMNATVYFTKSYKDTNKIYAVFMGNGAITYPSNKNITAALQIQGVDGYFVANGNGANITYDNTAKTVTYNGGAVANGVGYIITLS